MGKRISSPAKADEQNIEKESETVLTFNTQVEDPILNTKPKEEPKEDNEYKLPDWIGEAIKSNEPLQITDDPEKAGTLINENGVQKPNEITPPIQAAVNEFNMANANKRELIAKANVEREAFLAEQQVYLNRRKLRAVTVPEVPSGFIPYPEGTKIYYVPYTVSDIEAINNDDIPLLDKYRIMLDGIYADNIAVTELTFADFMFICDTRHLQALGDSHFKYPYICQSCGKAGTYQFQLSEVTFASLTTKLPVNVRFHSFPDEVFQFVPHTIGDIIRLLDMDKYWRKLGGQYISTEDGQKQIDRVAVNACRCISHSWDNAYFKLLEISENPEDRIILEQLDKALYHSTEPIKFNCVVPLDRKEQQKMAEQTANLVEGVASGEFSTTSPNEETDDIAPWAKAVMGIEDTKIKNRYCNAINTLDVLEGGIIIPFREHTVDMEYGILTSTMG